MLFEKNTIDKEDRQKLLEEQCMSVLNEAYFGKHPLLREIETQMSIIIKNLKKNPTYDVTTSKENLKIISNLEKLFNVESFSLIWSSDFSNGNGCTVPVSQILQFKNDLKTTRTSTGIKFANSKGLHAIVILQTGLVLTTNLNEKQLTAILLHEIGHNFYNTKFSVFMNKYLNLVSMIAELIQAISKMNVDEITQVALAIPMLTAIQLEQPRKFISKLVKSKNKVFSNTVIGGTFIKGLSTIVKQAIFIVKYTLAFPKVLKNIVSLGLCVPMTILNLFHKSLMKSHENERFSDTFASMYGYSKEIVEVRTIFEDRSNQAMSFKYLYEIPGFGIIAKYYFELVFSLNRLATFYDNGRSSSQSQMEYIKKELSKSDLNPKLKAELNEQLKQLEKIHEFTLTDKHNAKTANFFRILLTKLFGKNCFGNTSFNKEFNKLSYTIRGAEFDASFEDILDGNQVY